MGTVNRKQSKHKLVAGEVKSAVIVNNSDLTTTPGSGSNTTNTMPNKEVLADPLAALPTSHTKKYLPRQQTWSGEGPPSPSHQIPLPQTPSPTQSPGRPNTKSPFAKFQQMDNKQNELSPLTRQNSLPSLNERKVSAPPPSTSNTLGGVGNSGGGLRRSTVVARSPSSAKEVILSWVQDKINNNPNYPNLNVTNFSTSWNDGMAFCALIHHYYPEAFNYEELDPKNRRYNFDLAFRAAEHFADICPLLDVEDMVMFEKPDWKCVFTYVQTFFRRFRNGRDPPVPTKKLTLTPPHISTPAPTINLAKSIEVSTSSSTTITETISASLENDKKTESKAEKTESKAETKTVTKKAVKVVDPNQPYYFPAPEISEEKKLSLMSKYLDLDDEKPKKRTVNPGGGKKMEKATSKIGGSGT